MKEPCCRFGSDTSLLRLLLLIHLITYAAAGPVRVPKGCCGHKVIFPWVDDFEPARSHPEYASLESPAVEKETGGESGSVPRTYTVQNAVGRGLGEPKSRFKLRVLASPSTDHFKAVKYCTDLASHYWTSSVDVRVKVLFSQALGGKDVLGDARPGTNWFLDKFVYPVGMAKSILGQDVNKEEYGDERYDIVMRLNAKAAWYTGTDGQEHPDQYDLVTVCLHELYHGLMMSGGNINIGSNGTRLMGKFITRFTGRFDAFLATNTKKGYCSVESYRKKPAFLADAVSGDNLWFHAGGEPIAQLYAPRDFKPGSSLYHLSERKYGVGDDENGLMTPAMPLNYARHKLGEIVQQMQGLMMNVSLKGAPNCKNATAPIILSILPGDKSGNASVPTSECQVKTGSQCLSRNTLIAAVGGGVALLVVLLIVVGLLIHRHQSKKEIVLPALYSGEPGQHLADGFFNE